MKTVLAVFAHPDDETFICGGTLARLSKAGHTVKLVCATKGEMGRRMGIPPVATRESIAQIRTVELERAAAALGLSSVDFLGFRDKSLEIYPHSLFVERLMTLLEKIHPDVVITFHEEFGGHPDHSTIGKVTTEAFRAYASNHPSAELYFVAWARMLTAMKDSGSFTERMIRVDVSDTRRAKLNAYRAHETQSNILEFVWRQDESALKELPRHEYFVESSTKRTNQPMLGLGSR